MPATRRERKQRGVRRVSRASLFPRFRRRAGVRRDDTRVRRSDSFLEVRVVKSVSVETYGVQLRRNVSGDAS